MRWDSKTVLVTGAGGFMGSHLVERLVELGARVRAFVRYNSRNDWGLLEMLPKHKLDEIEIIAGELRDISAVSQSTKKVEVIFHLGSLISIPYSYLYPRETIETNIMGTLNVMSTALENNVHCVVHTSTSEVYGTAAYVPMDEKHPLQGQSPYSASKIGADMIAESYYRSFNLPVVIARPFNFFGPRQSARAVIPTIISQTLAPVPQIKLGATQPKRDYTYYSDVVTAFLSIAELQEALGEIINIGSNFEISIGDIVDRVQSIVGSNKPVISDISRVRPEKSEVERLWCNNAKANRLLGWQPKISFEEGLRKTIEWVSENINHYKADIYNF